MATSLKIDDALKRRVQQLASQRRRSPHWIMLEAIQQYVEREEVRESFKQEALASWTAFKETGRHLTGPEVRTWLTSWGTADESAAPECHKQSSPKAWRKAWSDVAASCLPKPAGR